MSNQMDSNVSHEWIDINDYSRLKNISISTIRRRIKANQVTNKFIDGKYFILVSEAELNAGPTLVNFNEENERLKKRMGKLQEELDDLRTLIAVYENQNNSSSNSQKGSRSEEPPAIPL